ncbi:MAG TPA: response regulator [Acetobacteraceae bacterium]|jgi:DNA-binding response OmpR family regulator|nr:response regulator [Acetobacteraceae bacterium]
MPAAATIDLRGLSILVIEDTALVADLVVDALQDAGCRVVGPAARLDQGLALARTTEGLAGALLDVNLAGEHCFPIADVLAARGVPFVFLTGYGEQVLPRGYRDVPRLVKPFDLGELLGLIERQFR